MKQFAAIAACTVLVSQVCPAQRPLDLEDEIAKINYSVGYQIGGDFERQGIDSRPDVLLCGIRDALSGTESAMTPEEMRTTMGDLGEQVAEQKKRQRQELAERYRRESAEFLAENAKKQGVRTRASGLQYKVLLEGTGKTPEGTDSVAVNYRGTLIDGTEFDSTYAKGQPATFRVDGVISGWSEALQLMKEGAKWQLFVPPDLAYADSGPLAGQVLLFDLELIAVNPE